MVKNRIFIPIILFVALLIGILYCIISIRIVPHNYYMYTLGRMEIKNPVLVIIGQQTYVCPDSAVICCNEPDWENRQDVYPYIFAVENEATPIYYTSLLHKERFWDRYYYPFEYTNIDNHRMDILVGRFYYDVTTFDAYMQDVNSEHWCDFSIESIGDYEPSHTSNMVDAPFQYRIAVRQHYTTWQIIKLRLQSKKSTPTNGAK